MTKPHTTLSEAVRALKCKMPDYRDYAMGGYERGCHRDGYRAGHRAALEAVIALVKQHEAQEPVAPAILEALSYHGRERDDLTLEEAVSVIRTGWRTVSERTKRAMVLQIAALLAAQPTLAATQADEGREAQVLRRLLAYRVAGAKLYADDGELQDNTTWPHIDFRRDSVDTIENKLGDRTRAAFAKLTPEQIDAAIRAASKTTPVSGEEE
jgi:hypothetical protein